MARVSLRYGKCVLTSNVPDENILELIEPRDKPGVADPCSEVLHALDNPLKSRRVPEIAKKGDKAVIVVDDATRSTPSFLMVPPILNQLNSAGVQDRDITVIFGRGSHRLVTPEEMRNLVGDEVTRRVKVVNHDCRAPDLVHVGDTSRGTRVYLNKTFVDADVRILTGDVELHYYAGYGGARKSVLPGVAGIESIIHNHQMAIDREAKLGNIEGNPVHLDMMEAAKLARVDFIINVVMNTNGHIVSAFAGDLEKVFLEGVKVVDEIYKVPAKGEADIVLTDAGGSPRDINFYQAHKALEAAVNIVRPGGVIVLAAECPESKGSQAFYDWMKRFKNSQEVEEEIKKNFGPGGITALTMYKALEKSTIISITDLPEYESKNVLRLKPAETLDEALKMAFDMVGRDAKVSILPMGSLSLPVLSKD